MGNIQEMKSLKTMSSRTLLVASIIYKTSTLQKVVKYQISNDSNMSKIFDTLRQTLCCLFF